jgi:hypothetical protein
MGLFELLSQGNSGAGWIASEGGSLCLFTSSGADNMDFPAAGAVNHDTKCLHGAGSTIS